VKGIKLKKDNGVNGAVKEFLAEGMKAGVWDAVLVPARVPSGDSYAWLLLRDPGALETATPLPPIMAISGARALYKLARRGTPKRVAAVMRPCEVRAAVELMKLEQISLENVSLISVDCPGAVPLKEYIADPQAGESEFEKISAGDEEPGREVCRVCDHFSITDSDLHFATMGVTEGEVLLVPASAEGGTVVDELGLETDVDLGAWETEVKSLTEKRKKAKEKALKAFRKEAAGPEHFSAILSHCIGCHSCRSVCPICYCRQCYFESDALKVPADNVLLRASQKGAARLPTDTFLFHLGRMSHMSLSCVSCGVCEDACPVSVPVAQLFRLVAANTQDVFEYEAGRDRDEPLPMTYYREDELAGLTAPYLETYTPSEK
jgi:formate dehydrogenase subunit beta